MDTDRNDELPENAPAADGTQGRDQGLVTTKDHDTIRRWAEDRHATPATARDPEDEAGIGVLRLDFGDGVEIEELTQIDWAKWFAAFDERGLTFAYDEGTRPDGSRTNYFHLEGADDRA